MKNQQMYLNYCCISLQPKKWIVYTFLYISLGSFISGKHKVIAATETLPPVINSPTAVENPYAKTELSEYQVAKAGPSEKINPFLDALVSAYMTNSQLRSKVEEQKSRDEQVSRSLGEFRPKLSVNTDTGINRTENQTFALNPSPNARARERDRRTIHSSSAGLNISQSIYNGGTDLANKESSENQALAGQYDYLNTEQAVLFAAISTYMDVIFREKAVEINKENESFLKEQLQALKVAVEVGDKTLTNQAQAESRLAEATAALSDAEADLQKTVAKYQTVIGAKPGLLVQPKPLEGLPVSRDALVAMAKDLNPAILQAIYNEQSAKNDVDAASGALLPKIDIQGGAARYLHQRSSRDRSNNASAVVKLTIPLYQGGGEYATIRQRAYKAAQARFDLERARKDTVEAAITAWEDWIAAKQKVESVLVQLKAAERARDGALLEAEVGERAYVEALDAQKDFLRAQLALLQATRDERVNQYKVLAAVGQLTAKNLRLPVENYDIKGHLEEAKQTFIGY
ncbi:MAG: TolC family outer membrane protein [Alphaproteobacteria bacterium]|nr:TolC family outer membrane protein [Alphaproteobacteria bacterium]